MREPGPMSNKTGSDQVEQRPRVTHRADRAMPKSASTNFSTVAAGVARAAYLALKNCVMSVYLYSGFIALRDAILSALGRSRVVVVYYHRVGKPDVLTKSPDDFARDLAFYRRNYECISLSELCRRLSMSAPFKRRAVVITFDDGYRDNFELAVPALRAAGLTATFFVATGFVGTQIEFPHDQRRAPDFGVPEGAKYPSQRASYPKLRWNDLREMEAHGFEIGSHTISHANLGGAGAEEIEKEVQGSLRTLTKELGAKPRPFSFPWGKPADISKAAIDAVVNAGYYSASAAYGGANTRGASPMNIRRVDVGNGNTGRVAFKAKVAGFDPDYYRLRLAGSLKSVNPMGANSSDSVSNGLEVSFND